MSDVAMLYKNLYSTQNTITYFEKYHIVSVPKFYTNSDKYGKSTNQEHKLWPLVETSSITDDGKTMIQIMNRAFYNALTLPRVDSPESLLDNNKFNSTITIKPWMHILEKIPTQRAKNIIFSSVSGFNRWKDVMLLKIQRMR